FSASPVPADTTRSLACAGGGAVPRRPPRPFCDLAACPGGGALLPGCPAAGPEPFQQGVEAPLPGPDDVQNALPGRRLSREHEGFLGVREAVGGGERTVGGVEWFHGRPPSRPCRDCTN